MPWGKAHSSGLEGRSDREGRGRTGASPTWRPCVLGRQGVLSAAPPGQPLLSPGRRALMGKPCLHLVGLHSFLEFGNKGKQQPLRLCSRASWVRRDQALSAPDHVPGVRCGGPVTRENAAQTLLSNRTPARGVQRSEEVAFLQVSRLMEKGPRGFVPSQGQGCSWASIGRLGAVRCCPWQALRAPRAVGTPGGPAGVGSTF